MLTKTYVEKVLFDEGGMDFLASSSGGALEFLNVKRTEFSGRILGFEHSEEALQVTLVLFPSFIGSRMSQCHQGHLRLESGNKEFVFTEEAEFLAFIRDLKALIDTMPIVELDIEATEFDPELDLAATEEARVSRQRKGQAKFRQRLEEYWHHRCAVTGITVIEVLRASHAKDWSECVTGAERLSPFNGLLLSANLDALFDKKLIAFDDLGQMLISASISKNQMALLGISPDICISLDVRHIPFMRWHRDRFFKMEAERKKLSRNKK